LGRVPSAPPISAALAKLGFRLKQFLAFSVGNRFRFGCVKWGLLRKTDSSSPLKFLLETVCNKKRGRPPVLFHPIRKGSSRRRSGALFLSWRSEDSAFRACHAHRQVTEFLLVRFLCDQRK